ncbi:hypothetical protein HNR62_001824 [Oceanisphaera litoralis]|uniref:Ig-like domain-containing protein n=1 Tax=Oceanisphaera litoralis TaxID=225144 RepID=UPI00195A312D|nr:Ig-like domain-containing protein [Oceanisphaera litoralis]MBM7455945.1 hypothetical protein [Oceanisphaera litoralis]
MNKWTRTIITPIGLFVATVGPAQAALSVVAPGPHTAISGGFPLWYEDENGLQLELCTSKAVNGGTAGAYMCTLINEPGVFDDADPLIFPDNWPGETFWFLAETSIPEVGNSGYELEVYVAALEAAFAAEEPKAGDQVGFARIRIRASVPVAGTYTVTHPYGVETFVVDAADVGRRAINMTRDIGIGAPGDFTGALGGDLGPFLQSVNGLYTETNPDTGLPETFIGNPNLTEPVTGSPLNTNFVRIDGPPGRIESDLFTLSGKVRDSAPSIPLDIERASYQRTTEQTNIEVFASSSANAEVCFRETLALVDGSPCLTDLTADNNGRFFVQQPPSAALPSLIVVTASSPTGAAPSSSLSSSLVDIVKINSATYSWDDNTLRIEATSSDEAQVPDLVATGFGPLSKSGTVQSLTIVDLPQPPASIRVQSAAGGADSEPVIVIGSAPVVDENQPPVAQADNGATTAGVQITLQVLDNDSDPEGNTPLGIVGLTQPAAGQGTVDSNGLTLTYTPPALVTSAFDAIFTYQAQDSLGAISSPATVTVRVSPADVDQNQPPVAQADNGATTAGTPITLQVLDNDSDPEGNTPLGIVGLTQPAAGQGTVDSNGLTLTYTPPVSVTSAFDAIFTYQAQDSLGAISSPATVTVTVSPQPDTAENLTVTSAELRDRRGRQSWALQGQTTVATDNSITVTVSGIDGPELLGTVTPTAAGNWQLSARTSGLVLAENPTVTISSAFGNTSTVPLTIR